VQDFAPIGRRISEILWLKDFKKLEIWGKAQRESPSALSPIGGQFSLVAKSRGQNSNALAYAERAVST